MELKDRLKELRKAARLSQSEVAEQLHMTQGAYGRYELGRNEPSVDTIKLLAALYNKSVEYIMGTDSGKAIAPSGLTRISDMPHHYVPMLGSVAAGVPLYMEQNYDVYVDSVREADFALTVEGNSMNPTYLDGDVIYIKAVPDVDDGQVCVVAVDDSATLKHLYHIPGGVQLVSDNPAYKPMIFTQENSESVRVLGVPVGFTRLFKRPKK